MVTGMFKCNKCGAVKIVKSLQENLAIFRYPSCDKCYGNMRQNVKLQNKVLKDKPVKIKKEKNAQP